MTLFFGCRVGISLDNNNKPTKKKNRWKWKFKAHDFCVQITIYQKKNIKRSIASVCWIRNRMYDFLNHCCCIFFLFFALFHIKIWLSRLFRVASSHFIYLLCMIADRDSLSISFHFPPPPLPFFSRHYLIIKMCVELKYRSAEFAVLRGESLNGRSAMNEFFWRQRWKALFWDDFFFIFLRRHFLFLLPFFSIDNEKIHTQRL